MTVGELKEFLEYLDDDAQVLMMQQEVWPFEYSIERVITREDLVRAHSQEDGDEDLDAQIEEEENPTEGSSEHPQSVPYHLRYGKGHDELPLTDVFLVEGQQLCYGDKRAWGEF